MWRILRSAETLQTISFFSGGGAIAHRHRMTAARTPAHLAHSELTGRILGYVYDVASTLGHGFSEAVLCRALAIALEEAGNGGWYYSLII